MATSASNSSYVVRLYYATNLGNGSLDTPHVDGVEVSRMGERYQLRQPSATAVPIT